MKQTYEQLEQERNELAAQVERLRSEFPLFDDDGLCEHEHHCEFTLLQERKRLHEMLAETPPAALASLKAQWQSEALCGFYDHLQGVALRNGWGTDSDAYIVSEELKSWCQQTQESSND